MLRLVLVVLLSGCSLPAQIPGPAVVDQRARWDKIFTDPEAQINREPNEFLKKMVGGRKPGRALDVGSGMGRNALWLASRGWDVTAIDFSGEGIRLTKQAAAAKGLEVTAVQISADEFDYGTERYDLVIGMYMHQIFSRNAPKIVKALVPGGTLLVEAFHVDVSAKAGRRLGYENNELLRAFDTLRVKLYEDIIGPGDYSANREPSPLIRLLAVKP